MPSNAWWKLRFKVRNKIKTFSNANILFISAIGSFLSNFRCGSEGFCTVEAPCLVSELVGVWNNGGFENRDCKLIQEAKQIKIKISTLHQNYKKTSYDSIKANCQEFVCRTYYGSWDYGTILKQLNLFDNRLIKYWLHMFNELIK